MKLVQITPGAGGMYCGNCLRDNALVAELRRSGHEALMLPLYLPLTLDEEDQSAGAPIFFSGVNVYLEQKFPWLRRMPGWLHRRLASPRLLRWAAGRAAKTRAEEVGELALSMFKGEDGNQARELDEMLAWLRQHIQPEAVCLSNVLLAGLARRLRRELGCPVISILNGEDSFVDSLPERQREPAWRLLKERCRDISAFAAPSRYYAELMSGRLELPPPQVFVVPNGINLRGFPETPPEPPAAPTLGFFARMCREKGLHLLVEAFIEIHRRGKLPQLRLKVGGGCGPGDAPFVAAQQDRLKKAGVADKAQFFPNLPKTDKIEFLRSLSVFSVPALYGEAFGLYLIEAMAAGVPVVQPMVAAFPEIVEATGGGLLAPPTSAGLADQIETLLLTPEKAQALGRRGQEAVRRQFSAGDMARSFLQVCQAAQKNFANQ